MNEINFWMLQHLLAPFVYTESLLFLNKINELFVGKSWLRFQIKLRCD